MGRDCFGRICSRRRIALYGRAVPCYYSGVAAELLFHCIPAAGILQHHICSPVDCHIGPGDGGREGTAHEDVEAWSPPIHATGDRYIAGGLGLAADVNSEWND